MKEILTVAKSNRRFIRAGLINVHIITLLFCVTMLTYAILTGMLFIVVFCLLMILFMFFVYSAYTAKIEFHEEKIVIYNPYRSFSIQKKIIKACSASMMTNGLIQITIKRKGYILPKYLFFSSLAETEWGRGKDLMNNIKDKIEKKYLSETV